MTEIFVGARELYRVTDGLLYQAVKEEEAHPSLLGAQYAGRILHLDKGLEGAFVDIGLAEAGFLPIKSQKKNLGLHEGQAVLVEIRRDGFDAKGPRLTFREILPATEKNVPACRKPPLPLWQRSLSALDEQEIKAIHCDRRVDVSAIEEWARHHATELLERIDHLPQRHWPSWEEEIAVAMETEVSLPSGAQMVFERTRALSVVDIDSAGMLSQGNMEQTAWLADSEAAKEIPRQLCLRNWGGIVIIDFIDLKSKERRHQLVDLLREQARLDPSIDWVGPMSRLGLVEIRRKRKGKELAGMFGRDA